MKQEALTSEVGKDWMPFEKKTRGKVWKAKPKKETTDDKNILPNELTDVLENASESELMELAGIIFAFNLSYKARWINTFVRELL